MAELTEAKKKEFLEAFSLFDKDGDKLITEQELGNVYRSLGGAPSAAQIRNMIKQVDADGDGALNEDEFMAFMQGQMAAASNEAEIKTAFAVMSDDKAGTGKVSVSTLKNILTTVGEKLTEDEADMLIADAANDTNDGMVDYKSFVHRMMSRP